MLQSTDTDMALGSLNTDEAAKRSEKEYPSENSVVSAARDAPSAHPQPETASPERKWLYA